MCDFSGRLVAWMDRELRDNEAVDVERHVRDCSECRRRVDAYAEASRAFVAYFDAAIGERTRRRLPRWVPVLLSGAAAAGLLLVCHTANIDAIPGEPRDAAAGPAVVGETATTPTPL